MSVAKVVRQQFLDDVTDAVGQVFLAHPLQCARCHDHKFDPVPTRDYYSIQAVFATTQFAEVEAPWLPGENRDGMDDDRHYHRLRHEANREMLARVHRQREERAQRWFKDRGLPYESVEAAKKANAPAEDIPPKTDLMTPDEFGSERIGRKWNARFSWEAERYRPIAYTVYNGKTHLGKGVTQPLRRPIDPMAKGRLEKTAILTGGDPFSPGELVAPGVLTAAGRSGASLPTTVGGRRTAFAAWLTSESNPLTARVMANRVWLYHFGQGIARNANNFGATGGKPTHPELLDWLASELIRSGWSVKHLHRRILASAAYQRASHHRDPRRVRERDPAAELYAYFRPRRLTAEELRDAMLLVSGELNPAMGGIPRRPDMNLEAALQPRMIMGTFAPSYVPNRTAKQRNRRTVYALKLRGQRDPFLETFNQPVSERSCELRETSTVAPQALTLLNGEETADRALALAARIGGELGFSSGRDSEAEDRSALGENVETAAIQRVFQLTLGRGADAVEEEVTRVFWRDGIRSHAARTPEPREFPRQVVRRANEENTGKPFTFVERLFVYDDYVPDPQLHHFNVRVRALAEVCLALLNSNEFLYVY